MRMTIKKKNLIDSVEKLVASDNTERREKRLAEVKEQKAKRQKDRWKEIYHTSWKLEHNAKRRDKYHSDPAYRERIRAQNRKKYKSDNENFIKSIDPRVGIQDRFSKYGQMKKIKISPSVYKDVLTFSKRDAYKVLLLSEASLWKYIRDGLIPEPCFTFAVLNNGVLYKESKSKVYTSEELFVIANILGAHFTKCHKYTKEDKDTNFTIITKVQAVRLLIKNEK